MTSQRHGGVNEIPDPVDPVAGEPSPVTFDTRADVVFLHSVDLGFLIADIDGNSPARRELLTKRAEGTLLETLMPLDEERSFGSLSRGKSEGPDLVRRMDRALNNGGKAVWSRSLLGSQAPIIFDALKPSSEETVGLGGPDETLTFRLSELQVRIFPRGVLSFERRWVPELHGDQAISVGAFIQACKKARELQDDEIWGLLDGLLRDLPKVTGIGSVDWRVPDETTKAFLQQHTLRHAVVFMESLPGSGANDGSQDGVAEQFINFDLVESDSLKSIVGILNLTQWYDVYSSDYVSRVVNEAVRNRQDELYLTDHDSSVIVLAGFWKPADPLKYYKEDLILAIQFELCRLGHLRYLAYYMRTDALASLHARTHQDNGREALGFVLDIQRAISLSSYDRPAEPLIRHGFTRRFLSQISRERGTQDSLEELSDNVRQITRATDLRTGFELTDQSVRISRRSLFLNVLVLFVTFAGVALALALGLHWLE